MGDEVVIIEAQVDTGDSAQDIAELDKGIDNVVSSSEKLSEVDKRFAALNKQIDAGGLTVKQMTKAVKEYQTIALQAGQDSPVGQEAIRRAAELKDEVGDLNAKVNALAHDGKNMQAALQFSGVVVSGYTAFQSVLAMVGSENEDLLKIITKLQAAQGALAAIEQVRAALEKESFLMLKLKNIQLAIQEQGYKKLFIQLLKNPYVAIGAAIIGVIGVMATLINRETEYERTVRMSKQAVDDLITSLDTKTKKALQAYDQEIALLQAAGKETFEAELEKQRLIIATQEVKLKALKLQRAAEQQANKEEIKELQELGGVGEGYLLLRQQKEKDTNGEIFKSRQELNKKIEDSEYELQAAKNTIDVLGTKHRKDEEDKQEKNYKDYLDKKKKADEDYVKSVLDGLEEIRRKEAERLDEARREEEYQNEINAQAAQNEEKLKQEQEFNLRRIGLELEAEEEMAAKKKILRQEEFDFAIGLAETEMAAITSMQQSIFEISNNLGKQDDKAKLERAKRQFNITKAVNISEALIDGAKSVTKAIAQFGPPPSPLGIAGIASAGAITGLQVAAIASRKFDGGGSSAAPSIPSSSSSGSNQQEFVDRNTNTTQTAGLIGNDVPMQRVAVFDSDLHAVRERNQMIEVRSTI